MTTLAADARRGFMLGTIMSHPVVASDIIYEGACVGDNGSGFARPMVQGDPFLGFAEKQVDNSGGAAGDKRVRCNQSGYIELPVTGVVITSVGATVYASDDDTFTLTGTSNTQIGVVAQYVSDGNAIVKFTAPDTTVGV